MVTLLRKNLASLFFFDTSGLFPFPFLPPLIRGELTFLPALPLHPSSRSTSGEEVGPMLFHCPPLR